MRNLTPVTVHSHSPAYLHQMEWAHNISALPRAWNWLVGEYENVPVSEIKALHYTLGIPMFREYNNCDYAAEWLAELHHMQHCAEG